MPKMTFWSEEKPDSIIESARNKVIADAEAKFDAPYASASRGLYPVGNELGVQPLRPSHFFEATGLPLATYNDQWTTPIIAAAGVNTWFNSKTPEEAFIIIEGFFNETFKLTAAASVVEALKPTLGGTELPWMHIGILQNFREPWGYFEMPMILTPETITKFEVINTGAIAAIGDELIGLVGEAIGERNSLIDSQP